MVADADDAHLVVETQIQRDMAADDKAADRLAELCAEAVHLRRLCRQRQRAMQPVLASLGLCDAVTVKTFREYADEILFRHRREMHLSVFTDTFSIASCFL